jgi:hypothetical protein
MATFTLTAKYQSTRTGGFHIDKGDQFVIHINMAGITPINLFNNSRCRDQLIKQFKINGIDLPPTDPLYNSPGAWDIKMKP